MTDRPDTDSRSLDGLRATQSRMNELFNQLEAQTPDHIHALFEEYPELNSIHWSQYLDDEGADFRLTCDDSDLDLDPAPGDVVEDGRDELIADQVRARLRSIPMTVMVALFGHAHTVHFGADSYDVSYRD